MPPRESLRRKISRRANGLLAFLWLAAVVAGCQSGQRNYYIAPRITGRVVAADSLQPLNGVNVRRIVPNRDSGGAPPKGGELAERDRGVWTDSEGKFELSSERALSLLSRSSWWSVNIAYKKSGFQTVVTNYTLAQSTNTVSGEPLVEAGDVLMSPASR